MDSFFFSQQMAYCLATLLVYMALNLTTVHWKDRPFMHPRRVNAVCKTVNLKFNGIINMINQSTFNVVDIFNFSGSASLSPSFEKSN